MPHLVVTRLKLKSKLQMLDYQKQNIPVFKQILAAPGFIRGKAMSTLYGDMWTMSLWGSEDDMNAFYRSGAHRQVMPLLQTLACEAAAVSFVASDLCSWKQAHAEMRRHARFQAIREPSESQLAGCIPDLAFLTFSAPMSLYRYLPG